MAETPSTSSGSEAEAITNGESGSENVSGDESDDENEDGSQDGSEDEGDSDSLDSSAPRKRRKVSPVPDDEDELEDVPEVPVRFMSAPSRIKRKDASGDKPAPRKPVEQDPSPPADTFGGATTAPTDPNTTFESLGVHPWLVRSLTNMAIRRPTGIQKGCIPEILNGRDCIGGSRTGSGKTVAFAVPILQKWAEDPSAIFAVVLTPTR